MQDLIKNDDPIAEAVFVKSKMIAAMPNGVRQLYTMMLNDDRCLV